jgi:spermidine synthase
LLARWFFQHFSAVKTYKRVKIIIGDGFFSIADAGKTIGRAKISMAE